MSNKPDLQLLTNPEDPEFAGAKRWAQNLVRYLTNPGDKEAYEFLKRQNQFDEEGRPKPTLVASEVSRQDTDHTGRRFPR